MPALLLHPGSLALYHVCLSVFYLCVCCACGDSSIWVAAHIDVSVGATLINSGVFEQPKSRNLLLSSKLT